VELVRCLTCGAESDPAATGEHCPSCGAKLPPVWLSRGTGAPERRARPQKHQPQQLQQRAEEAEAPLSVRDRAARKVSGSLLGAALLLLICNGLSLVWLAQNAPLPQAQLAVAIGLMLGLSAVYGVLSLWARYQPLPAATLGLLLFLGLMVHEFSAGTPWRGLGVKIFLFIILLEAVVTARRAGKAG